MRRTKSAEDRVRDLHSLLLQKTLDLDSALEMGRKLRREYHSTRQDAEGMLQVKKYEQRNIFLRFQISLLNIYLRNDTNKNGSNSDKNKNDQK